MTVGSGGCSLVTTKTITNITATSNNELYNSLSNMKTGDLFIANMLKGPSRRIECCNYQCLINNGTTITLIGSGMFMDDSFIQPPCVKITITSTSVLGWFQYATTTISSFEINVSSCTNAIKIIYN